MGRPFKNEPIPDTRLADCELRRIWRERSRAYYQKNAKARAAKIAAVDRFRAENPDKVRETQRLSRLRNRRGVSRTYRRAEDQSE